MSWNFNFVSQNSKALQEEIVKQEYCPPNLREFLSKSIEEIMVQGLEDDHALHVESNGHSGSDYTSQGSFKIAKVKTIK
jgi:hypothetical protein